MKLRVLSAGAAKAVVGAVAAQSGDELQAAFGAVGAMRDKLLAGEPCDLIVLTRTMLEGLAAEGRVLSDTIGDLGRVHTGIAVRDGTAPPDVASAAGLRAALLAAEAIFVPDTLKSTAGKHVAGVLAALGIAGEVGGRLKEFPNGATAMRAMGDARDPRAIGCTQVSEILYTSGITLVGALPDEFDLATLYSAAVCRDAAGAQAARQFVERLAGATTRELRARAGFVC